MAEQLLLLHMKYALLLECFCMFIHFLFFLAHSPIAGARLTMYGLGTQPALDRGQYIL